MAKKLFLVTTETSGDLLGGRLVGALKTLCPDLQVSGVGGDLLVKEGMHTHYHVTDFNVMGLVEVLSQLRRLKRMFNQLLEHLREDKPDAILLIDAPDFNLRFAKAVKDMGIPVIYYVSPQVWAWRKNRAHKLADMVDHLMVLFRFETKIYDEIGLANTWVGHPLVDELGDFGEKADFLAQHDLDPNRPLVALAPGSRPSEVKRLLPTMVETARRRLDRWQPVLPLAPNVDLEETKALLGDVPIPILQGMMRPVMAHADAAVVASGTATLETGLLRTPMVVGYKLKPLSYWIARTMVKVPHIALVNIICDKRVAPELIQGEFHPDRIVPLIDEMLEDGPVRREMLDGFDLLESNLNIRAEGDPDQGPAERAAAVVASFL